MIYSILINVSLRLPSDAFPEYVINTPIQEKEMDVSIAIVDIHLSHTHRAVKSVVSKRISHRYPKLAPPTSPNKVIT